MKTHLHHLHRGFFPSCSTVKGAIRIQVVVGLSAGILVGSGIFFIIPKTNNQANTPTTNQAGVPTQSESTSTHPEAGIILGEDQEEYGLKHHVGDGPVTVTNKDGVSCVKLRNRNENYIYFSLDPRFKPAPDLNAIIEVEFLAPVSGSFDVQYDGYKFGERPESVFSDTPVGIRFDGWPHWHRVSLEMSNARLGNRQHDGADFRLRVLCREFYVRRVTLTQIEPATQPPPVLGVRTKPR